MDEQRRPFWYWPTKQWYFLILVIFGSYLNVVVVEVKWRCESHFSQYLSQIGRSNGYFKVVTNNAIDEYGEFKIEKWREIAMFTCVIFLTLILSASLAQIGFKIVCRRFKFRPRRFMRNWAISAIILPLFYISLMTPISFLRMFTFRTGTPGGSIDIYSFVIGFVFLPTLLYRSGLVRRSKRLTPRCRTCGYSLRGLMSANCPECGVAVIQGPI